MLFIRIIWYGVTIFSITTVIILFFDVVSGINFPMPIGMLQDAPILVFHWIFNSYSTILDRNFLFWRFLVIINLLLTIFILIINIFIETKGMIINRNFSFIGLFLNVRSSKVMKKTFDFYKYSSLVFLLIPIAITSYTILEFMQTNGFIKMKSIINTYGWLRFTLSIFLLYLLAAVILILITKSRAEFNVEEKEEDPTKSDTIVDKYGGYLYFGLPILALIISNYAISIYPYLPQQVGGGNVVEVQIITSNDDINILLTGTNTKVYLVDRVTNGSLFMLFDTQLQEQRIIEISSSELKSVVYKSIVFPSLTPTISSTITQTLIPTTVNVISTPTATIQSNNLPNP
jgi:hypothetical protein